MKYARHVGILCVLTASSLAASKRSPNDNEFVGSDRCVACHAAIAEVQHQSNHFRTLRKVQTINDLLTAVPLRFVDTANASEYRLEKSARPNFALDLVATQEQRAERLNLLWAFGAGRKGITFIGRTGQGEYGQGLVSWYRKINKLDITTGLKRKANDAHEALADWMTPAQLEHCFNCHVTRHGDASPEALDAQDAGIRCERCHGPGKQHLEAAAVRKGDLARSIRNPGTLKAIEQVFFCGACHGTPPGTTAVHTISRNMADSRTVRFPPQRLVLSRCFNESQGKLKCTTCHNPHENLPQLARDFDAKCFSCHAGPPRGLRSCPQASRDCIKCHMPRETGFMTHSDFADHWIRRTPVNR